jgi:hypothetical protein
MKINVEIDCTPDEARRAIGLPDLTPVHDRYIQLMLDSMDKGMVNPEMIESMLKSWMPMGEAGMNFWRGMFDLSKGRGVE